MNRPLLISLTLVQMSLVAALPLSAIGPATPDDRLYLSLAVPFLTWLGSLVYGPEWFGTVHAFLANGDWLGTYNNITLIKGPVYPIWIAFCALLGLPLLFAQNLLYIGAGWTLLSAVKKIIPSPRWLTALYVIYLFNPMIVNRVVREGIYPALTVFIIAGFIGLYTYQQENYWKLGLWALLSGFSLSLFLLTREEGIWLIPLVFLLISYILIQFYFSYKFSSEFFKKLFICLLPLFILFSSLQLVTALNKFYYGVNATVELKTQDFLSAYGALTRVEHPQFIRYVPVPKAVRQEIYKVSPVFKELKPHLEGKLTDIFGGPGSHGCSLYPETCGEIAGGWFLWAFREAVSWAGYYNPLNFTGKGLSGTDALTYYRRLASEVNAACDTGKLKCRPLRATLTPPFRQDDRILLAKTVWRGWQILLNSAGPRHPLLGTLSSSGTEEQLLLFRDLTRENVAPLPNVPAQLSVQTRLDTLKIHILGSIAKIYHVLTPILVYLAVFIFLIQIINSLRTRHFNAMILINTAILSIIFSRLVILAYIDITSFPGLHPLYFAPLYPLLFIFSILVISDGWIALQRFLRDNAL